VPGPRIVAPWGLRGTWHRTPLLAQAAEQFKTAVSRAETGLESREIHRHKVWATLGLHSAGGGAAYTPQEACFGPIRNMVKWHKRPSKAATLCHNFDSEMPCRRARPTTNDKASSLLPMNSFGKIVETRVRQLVGFAPDATELPAVLPETDIMRQPGTLSRSTPSRPAQNTGTGPARSAS
jgi:hypothetical protein